MLFIDIGGGGGGILIVGIGGGGGGGTPLVIGGGGGGGVHKIGAFEEAFSLIIKSDRESSDLFSFLLIFFIVKRNSAL